jgi:hypothetical protein
MIFLCKPLSTLNLSRIVLFGVRDTFLWTSKLNKISYQPRTNVLVLKAELDIEITEYLLKSFTASSFLGPIIETAGVLALSEIDDINSWATKSKRCTDAESQCDFMTYDDNNEVAWPKA